MRRESDLRLYGAVAVTDAALAACGSRRLRRLTKPLLMPLLAAHVASVDGAQDTKPFVLAGLGLSGLGDIALLADGERAFAAGLSCFLAAHCCYLAALGRRRRGRARRLWWIAAAYVTAWCGLNVVLFPRTGRLRLPVLLYGTALALMSLAALDTGQPHVAAGGAAFLVSDSLLALDTFDAVSVPCADGLVMLSYATAQGLISAGLARRVDDRRDHLESHGA